MTRDVQDAPLGRRERRGEHAHGTHPRGIAVITYVTLHHSNGGMCLSRLPLPSDTSAPCRLRIALAPVRLKHGRRLGVMGGHHLKKTELCTHVCRCTHSNKDSIRGHVYVNQFKSPQAYNPSSSSVTG